MQGSIFCVYICGAAAALCVAVLLLAAAAVRHGVPDREYTNKEVTTYAPRVNPR